MWQLISIRWPWSCLLCLPLNEKFWERDERSPQRRDLMTSDNIITLLTSKKILKMLCSEGTHAYTHPHTLNPCLHNFKTISVYRHFQSEATFQLLVSVVENLDVWMKRLSTSGGPCCHVRLAVSMYVTCGTARWMEPAVTLQWTTDEALELQSRARSCHDC